MIGNVESVWMPTFRSAVRVEVNDTNLRIIKKLCLVYLGLQADLDIGINDENEREGKLNALQDLMKSSQLSQTKHEILGYYLRFEQYFMEESVAKAVSMDTIEQGQHTSSMVDDTFFIVRKCIR